MLTSQFGVFYGCTRFPACKGAIRAHKDGTPIGTPVDKETRRMRVLAHEVFDTLWRHPERNTPHLPTLDDLEATWTLGPDQVFATRERAYEWLQEVMGLSKEEAHIGQFSSDQCKKLIEAVWACEDGVARLLLSEA